MGQLRADGHTGRILVVDRDPDAPYDRPPLSKDFLFAEAERPEAPWWCDDCELVTGEVTSLDPFSRTATVCRPDGSVSEVLADEIVIATGSAPVRIPGQPDGVAELRTAADARFLRAHAAGKRRVIVLGAGTVGTELASSLTTAGTNVTLVDVAQRPLQRFFGGHLGDEATGWIRQGGVDLRLSTSVTAIRRYGGRWVVETDSACLDADLVVSAIGTRPVTNWLAGSGIAVGDGVFCDADGRVQALDGALVPAVYAVGDVASWVGPEGARRRREDWTSAQRQGRHVARKLLGSESSRIHDLQHDYFWSNQFGRRIQVLGTPVPEGRLAQQVDDPERRAAFYTVEGRDGTLAWISVNRPREFALAMRESTVAAR